MHFGEKVFSILFTSKLIRVYVSRSPHRPNLIGLTLAKLELVEGTRVHVSGIDLIEGTPVLDIKPYIPEYDKPR